MDGYFRDATTEGSLKVNVLLIWAFLLLLQVLAAHSDQLTCSCVSVLPTKAGLPQACCE